MNEKSNRILNNDTLNKFLRAVGIKRNKIATLCDISRQTFDYKLSRGEPSEIALLSRVIANALDAIATQCYDFSLTLKSKVKNARARKTRRLRNRAT